MPAFRPRIVYVPMVLVVCLMLWGCGYRLGADATSVLKKEPGEGLPTLIVKEVENPTLYPWLNYLVRERLRDEVNARNLAEWVDSGRADYAISLNLEHFTNRSWTTDSKDNPVLYEAQIKLEATVYRGDSNEVVWRSGPMFYTDRYDQVGEKQAAEEILRELIRQLVDKMRQEF